MLHGENGTVVRVICRLQELDERFKRGLKLKPSQSIQEVIKISTFIFIWEWDNAFRDTPKTKNPEGSGNYKHQIQQAKWFWAYCRAVYVHNSQKRGKATGKTLYYIEQPRSMITLKSQRSLSAMNLQMRLRRWKKEIRWLLTRLSGILDSRETD